MYHGGVSRPWISLGNAARGRILYGIIGEENPNHPGTYFFQSTDGFAVSDAHVLSPDVDAQGTGEITKPRAGSPCVAVVTSDGGQVFICGFHPMPVFDESADDPPVVGNPDDNIAAGDKTIRTAGGATIILKRGGAVIMEGGAGTSVLLNPTNNQATIRSANFKQSADGYLSSRGRQTPGQTAPETKHEEHFLHQLGNSYDRFTVAHGNLENNARRRLTLASVVVAGGNQTATIVTRETYKSDGTWVGEGPKYQWGGESADEPAVLGNQLVEALDKLIDIIKNLKVNTAWGPSTPPLPNTIADLEALKNELSGKILSTFLFLSKDPATLV